VHGEGLRRLIETTLQSLNRNDDLEKTSTQGWTLYDGAIPPLEAA